jgi:hypothetical protein
MGGVGVLLVRTSFTHTFLVAQFLIGAVGVAFAVKCVIAIIEDLSVLLDRRGIEKLRFLHAGKFLVRKRLAWNDIEGFTQRELTYRFKSAEFKLRLNIASFTNETEFIEFMQANLPAETIAASLSNTLAPSRRNIMGRWIGVLLVLTGGLWLLIDGNASGFGAALHILGGVLAAASLAWAVRVLESGSVRLDTQGLEQLKVLDQREFFVRRRMAWEDVLKASTFLATCKFECSDFYIRVDASYFAENEEVAFFANRHLPEGVFGETKETPR